MMTKEWSTRMVNFMTLPPILFLKYVETDRVGDRYTCTGYTFSGIDKVEESIDMQATLTNLHVYVSGTLQIQ